jgi:hypothetical protein
MDVFCRLVGRGSGKSSGLRLKDLLQFHKTAQALNGLTPAETAGIDLGLGQNK